MKIKRWLTLALASFMLTGCIEVYADALPKLAEPETYIEELHKIEAKESEKEVYEGDRYNYNATIEITMYRNGASMVMKETEDGYNYRNELHVYHINGTTGAVINLNGDKQEGELSDPNKTQYEDMYSEILYVAVMSLYQFYMVYELASMLVDKEAVDEIKEYEGMDTLKLTSFFGTFKLEVKMSEKYGSYSYETSSVIEFGFKDDRPAFIKAKSTQKDSDKNSIEASSDTKYEYKNALPSYAGPKVRT